MTQATALSLDDATLEVVDAMYRWIRTHGTHGAAHPLAVRTSHDLATAVRQAQPPVSLQFVLGAAFREGKLLPMDAAHYQRSELVAKALRNTGVQELAIDGDVSDETLGALGAVLARAVLRPTSELDELELDSVQWRPIPHVAHGVAAEALDPDTAATVDAALATATAERLPADGESWPWPEGMDCIRRLERALATSTFAALRAVECAPSPWSVPRRAVSGALHVLVVLRALGASSGIQRAIAHATLLLAIRGLGHRSGRPIEVVASEVREQFFRGPRTDRFEPHHLRIATVVHVLAEGSAREGRTLVVMPMIELAYDLERRRVAADGSDALSRVDLLAFAVMDPRYDERWARALVNCVGMVPPGATVALTDGRVGVVVGPGSSPWRPELLIGGELVRPDADVKLVS